MPKTTLPALLLCLPLIVLLPGPAPARPPVRQLIDQLGDRDYSKRRQAEDGLRAEGARALPALKQALNHPDAEVRRRVRELVPALETQALLAPKRVTLKLTDRPVGEALDEIARQTGYKIELGEAPPGTYRFDLKGVPFWEALDRVGRDAGLVLQPPDWGGRLRLSKRPGYTAHVCYDGPIRFTADSIQLYREMEFGLAGPAAEAPKRSEALTLHFTVFSEPNLPILGLGEPRLTAANDTEKRSMLPAAPDAAPRRISRFGNVSRSWCLRTQVQLCRPSGAPAIASVRGTVPLTLLVADKPVVLADKLLSAKGKRAEVGAIRFLFEEVNREPDGAVRVRLSVTNQAPEAANDWTWMNALSERVEARDERGGACPLGSCSTVTSGLDGGPSHTRLGLVFRPDPANKVGPPSKLIFHDWTTREHLASFEFKELPLP